MAQETIKMVDAKKMAFAIDDLKVFQCADGLWIVTMRFKNECYGMAEIVGLETHRGDLRLFKSADAAIKAARDIGFDGRIWVDWES